MKLKLKVLFMLFLCFFLLQTINVYASDKERNEEEAPFHRLSKIKKKVALIAFKNRTNAKNDKYKKFFQEILITALKKNCRDIIITQPLAKNYPKVLNNLPKVLNTNFRNNLTMALICKQLGINAAITGDIIEIRVETEEKGFWFLKKIQHSMFVHVLIDVYDSETGAKLFSENITDEVDLKDNNEDADKKDNQSVVESIISDIVEDISPDICDAINSQPFKAGILSVSGVNVVVAGGENSGIKKGMFFKVYDKGKKITGAQGQNFIVPGLEVGEIKITKVLAETSEAKIVSGEKIQKGDTIKR